MLCQCLLIFKLMWVLVFWSMLQFLYYRIPHKCGFFFETLRAGDTVKGEARKEL